MTTADEFPIEDTVCAWVPHGRFVVPGHPGGALHDLRFAAKDLFDVAGHPTATFTAAIVPAGEAFEAKGTLALRGAEHPVTLPFTLVLEGDTARMQGKVTLDRRDFGMGPSYGDEKTVGFTVDVEVALVAKRGG